MNLHCRHCRGAGVFITRRDRQGHPIAVDPCGRCHGTGSTPCCLCETAHAVELDIDNNPLCAECAANERAIEASRERRTA